MLRHSDIWLAIDRLAAQYGLSPSGLARRAGLDPTTFNPSKRKTAEGKLRWPSTESLAKILDATGATLEEFVALIRTQPGIGTRQRLPLIGYAQAATPGHFDEAGYPTGSGWDEAIFPDIQDPHAYALEISGASMEPVYRDGDVIVVSPAATNLRRGDRVVIRTAAGEVLAKELARMSANRVELQSLNADSPDRTLHRNEIAWMARIVWVSQ
jgi:phage repressor protein C with HTH and peptisase S24 domain